MRPKRQNVVLAFAGAVFLHGVVLLVFALVVALRPPAPPPVAPPEEPVRLELVQDEPPPTPPPLFAPGETPTPTPKPKLVVDATGEDATGTPSPDALISDRTTRASSAETGDNERPGASQAGRRMATFQFDPSPPAPGLVQHTEAAVPTPPPQTAPAQPQPDRFVQQAPAPRPNAATPAPAATPSPTAAPDEFAMAMATPTPALLPEDPFDPSIRSTSPPLPKPAARSTPTPRTGNARSAENGGGLPRGPGGVETLATPAGRYARQVTTMIKFIWSRSIESRADVAYGTTVIRCSIDKDGLAIGPRVVSNTSDTTSASIALQAVVVARLPAMPPDVVAELEGKRLGLDITFDYTPMPQEAARR